MQYRTKKASYPKCPVTGQRLAGIKALRPAKYSNKRMAKREKTVNRIYGGNLSHGVVRERIVRAFLLEERKIVKKVRLITSFVVPSAATCSICLVTRMQASAPLLHARYDAVSDLLCWASVPALADRKAARQHVYEQE